MRRAGRIRPEPGFCRRWPTAFEYEFGGLTSYPAGPRGSVRQLREQAIGLRRAGHSRREVTALPGITSNETLGKDVDADSPGCLVVNVRQSADPYRRIEGWVRAVMTSRPVS